MSVKGVLTVGLVALLALAIVAGHRWDGVEIPDYAGFGECRTGDHDLIMMVRACTDGRGSRARNVVLEFRNKATRDPVFLIWSTIYRDENTIDVGSDTLIYSAKLVVVRIYGLWWGYWQLAETRVLDPTVLPRDKPMPYFDADSPLGRQYFKYFLDRGRNEKDIVIPTLTFSSQPF